MRRQGLLPAQADPAQHHHDAGREGTHHNPNKGTTRTMPVHNRGHHGIPDDQSNRDGTQHERDPHLKDRGHRRQQHGGASYQEDEAERVSRSEVHVVLSHRSPPRERMRHTQTRCKRQRDLQPLSGSRCLMVTPARCSMPSLSAHLLPIQSIVRPVAVTVPVSVQRCGPITLCSRRAHRKTSAIAGDRSSDPGVPVPSVPRGSRAPGG